MKFLSVLLPFLLQNVPPDDDEFNLFLFAILILGLIVIIICVVIGLLLALLALLVVFVFITAGALSASVLVGLHKKSLTAGFRIFVIVFTTLASTVIGSIFTAAFNEFLLLWTTFEALLYGAIFGFAGGLASGSLIALAIRKTSAYFKDKLEKRRLSRPS